MPDPIHWQENVKTGPDQDAMSGWPDIRKPVPVGEPATWCQCMIVSAERTG